MRKKLLFVIDSLDVAGAEKSLVTLLNLLDYTKYEVDLQLFAHGNILEKLVPKEVNILKPLNYTKFAKISLKSALIHAVTTSNYKMLSSRIRNSFKIRIRKYSNKQKARIYWERVSEVIENN